MSVSTTSSNSSNLHLYYEKKLLSTLEPRLQLQKLGKKQKLPYATGKQVKWLRYSRVAPNTNPLTEGTAPSEISFTTGNVTATIQQYGQFSKVSDLLSETAIDPVLQNLSERFGRAAARTVEELIIAELDAQGSYQYANGRANANAVLAGDILTHSDLLKGVINMKIAYVAQHEMGDYMAVIHPACQYDLLNESAVGSWVDVNKYAGSDQQSKILRGEFGKMYGVRMLVSDEMSSTNNSGPIAVRNNYLLGEEAFGVVELDGDSIQMIIKDHKSGGVSNPLEQFATVGYKIQGFAAKALNDDAAQRITVIAAASTL